MLNLTSKQLLKAADLKEKIAALESELNTILSGAGSGISSPLKAAKTAKKKGMSAAGRARIAAAQKTRWAKVKSAKGKWAMTKAEDELKRRSKENREKRFLNSTTIKRKMSAAAKAKISAAAKRRWAKAKASGKNSL